MRKSIRVIVVLGLVSAFFVGCRDKPAPAPADGGLGGARISEKVTATPARGHDRSDFSNPEALKEILGEAILFDTVEPRRSGGGVVVYHGGAPYTGWIKWMHDNGKVKQLGRYKDGQVEGLATSWRENGQKSEEHTFRNGKPVGVSTSFYDNGQKSEEHTIRNGKPVGVSTKWHYNGQKKQEATFKDGKMEGLATMWDEDGKVLDQTHFKNGKPIVEGE